MNAERLGREAAESTEFVCFRQEIDTIKLMKWSAQIPESNRFPNEPTCPSLRGVSAKIRFNKAAAAGIVLAKVGNPSREEPLQTSKTVCRIEEKDRELLTSLFLKPFRSLMGYCFHHHSALEQNEMYACAREIFEAEDGLFERGCDVAKRLYAKSNHPNIKSGDLCIALVKGIIVDGQQTEGLCILKSESVEPFLSISERGGDLKLATQEGINPDKIDKGCLVLNHLPDRGYHVLTFDRSSGESRFWVRDFLGLKPIPDDAYLTNQYAEMAVSFAKEQPVGVAEKTAKAKEAVEFFDKRERFSLQEFEEEVLRKDPEMVKKFKQRKERLEEEQGQKLGDSFGISPKGVTRAKKQVGGVMKLDTGVELRLLPHFEEEAMEKGYDEERKMEFVKVYYHSDLAQQ